MLINLLHLKFAMVCYSFAYSEPSIDGIRESLSIFFASQS
jgi:hypothetical protein